MGEEGKAVRQAIDGPKFEHDELLGQIATTLSGEHERSSDASESSAVTKEFTERTGMNSKAFTWLKAIVGLLPKKDGQHKAMDVIRSLERGLPMVKDHVAGQSTAEMDLDEPDDGKVVPINLDTDLDPDAAEEFGVGQ